MKPNEHFLVRMIPSESSSYENRQNEIHSINLPEIEVFKNQYQDRDYVINMEVPEFTAICPKTGLPDFGIIQIRYIPDHWCMELKSLKEYFTAYRSLGIFHENVVNRASDDIIRCCQPRRLRVHADYNVRGGIKTRVSRNYSASAKLSPD